MRPALICGNSCVSFVVLSAVASGENVYGLRHLIFIFRKLGNEWRILYLDPNANIVPMNSHFAPPLVEAFAARIRTDEPDSTPSPAELFEPPDGATLPRHPEITWKSDAPTTSAFVIESQFGLSLRNPDWGPSALAFPSTLDASQPFHVVAPFGVGAQPHRWRVWTLSPSGSITTSNWRTISFSN